MRSFSWVSLAAAISPVLAIPPTQFNFPSSSNNTELTVAYTFNGNLTLVQPGQLFGGNVTRGEPQLAINPTRFQSLADYSGQYVVIMIDPDAPSPDNPTRRSILHWLAGGISQTPVTSGGNNMLAGQRTLTNSTPAAVPYAAPGPPLNSSAHRYILYAFKQPANFAIPSIFNASNRANFDIERFVRDSNLGTPAAANYIYVSRQEVVPGTFIALPGSVYPGGNGDAIFATGGNNGAGSGTGNGNDPAAGAASSGIQTSSVAGLISLAALGLAWLL